MSGPRRLFDSAEDASEYGQESLRDIRAGLARMVGIFENVLIDCWDEHDLATFRADATQLARKLCAIEDVIVRGVREEERASCVSR
jgi:hypothetical protein